MAMVKKHSVPAAIALLLVALLLPSLQLTDAQIGVCYGSNGNNLPSEQDVVNLYKSNGIGAMRIYSPDHSTLQALQGSNIKLILGVPNENIHSLGTDPSAASRWVQINVVPYASSIKYIAVGNEVPLSDHQTAPFVGPALQNVYNALNSANLCDQIKVSTAIGMILMANSFPPSAGTFTDMSFMGPIVNFLTSNGSPLLVNIYPYSSYIEQNIDINYALLNPGTVVIDSGNQLQYHNLFDAQVDAVYAALSKANGGKIHVVVSESGWPSDPGHSNAGNSASVHNAGTYYRNLISHVKQGTPLKPGPLETYLFAMFDENQKSGAGTEQHFGLFSPNQQQKYQLSFN